MFPETETVISKIFNPFYHIGRALGLNGVGGSGGGAGDDDDDDDRQQSDGRQQFLISR